jgi:hypothetical protein
MRYPGHERLDGIRQRLGELRSGTAYALGETKQLRIELEALRAEVAELTIALGDQLAAMGAAIESLAEAGTASGALGSDGHDGSGDAVAQG